MARYGFAEPRRPWWGLIRLAFSSPAVVAMVQAQDVLGLGSRSAHERSRVSAGGSWRWQLPSSRSLSPALAARLHAATEESGRLRLTAEKVD